MSDGFLILCHHISYSMPTRYTFVCDDEHTRDIERLARENDVTEEEVLRQLVDLGLSQVNEQRRI